MKKARFLLPVLPLAALAAIVALRPFPGGGADAEADAAASFRYEWVVYYYMAYDNGLDVYATPIREQIARGLVGDRVAVAISADLASGDGMTRTLMTGDDYRTSHVEEESSADPKALAAELDWLATAAPARRYAIVFLDHGGGRTDLCQDLRPAAPDGPEWLQVEDVAGVVGRWRARIPGEVELLFLQQCGKGALSTYHALRGTARWLMGSETRVGAPNSYYAATLRHLCAHPEIDGKALAAKILESESPDMFTDYAVLDAAALAEIPERMDAVLAPLFAGGREPFVPATDSLGPLWWDFEPDQRFHDGLTVLRAYYEANAADPAPLAAFERWTREHLVVAQRISSRHAAAAPFLHGFTLLLRHDIWDK